jgi:hypothetical protein
MLSTPSRPISGPILNASLPGARSRKPRLASVAARRDAHLAHPVFLVDLLEEEKKP